MGPPSANKIIMNKYTMNIEGPGEVGPLAAETSGGLGENRASLKQVPYRQEVNKQWKNIKFRPRGVDP